MASLSDRTKKLNKEYYSEVERIYGESFSLDVRFHLAHWIEEQFKPGLNIPDSNPQLLVELSRTLFTKLDEYVTALPDDPSLFLSKKKLRDDLNALRMRYHNYPAALAVTVKQCLDQEAAIVARAEGCKSYPPHSDAALVHEIRQSISFLKNQIRTEISTEVNRIKQEHESINMDVYTLRDMNTSYTRMVNENGESNETKKALEQKNKMQMDLTNKLGRIIQRFKHLEDKIKGVFDSVKGVQKEVLDTKLDAWKREQQLAGNGLQITQCLENIQEWCEGIAEILWTSRTMVKQLEIFWQEISRFQAAPTPTLLPDLIEGFTSLLTNLVTGTFIIEKQPPQVMKTNTRFTATVRLLVGGQLNVHMASPNVTVSIISESQANQLLKSPNKTNLRKEDYSSGDILNGIGNMEYHANTRQVSVTFRNLQLKKIRRTEKKGTESVMEEKFSVCFWTDFSIGDLKLRMYTLSLPVVVIVHGNQEPQALATITWDNAFAEWGRRPFVVPDKVSWFQMAEALNMKWTSACGSTRGLTEENFYFLATKAFRNPNLGKDDIKNLVISWSQFCREPLPDRNFTFWEWFYRVMNLTSLHMRGPWNEGLIMGFVSKHRAEELLLNCQAGTFLLRYSDSELGGVTIAYVRQDPMVGKLVQFVAPFVSKDLSQRSIADTIFDLQENLTFLYPTFPSDLFKQFSSVAQKEMAPPASSGYVPHGLKIHVQSLTPEFSNPNTPNPYEQNMYMGNHYQEDTTESMDYNIGDINIHELLDMGVYQAQPGQPDRPNM
jgi:signal transducer and activator of transcription 5B